MVSDFPKMPTSGWDGAYHLPNRRSVLFGQSKRNWKRKCLQMVRKFVMDIPFRNCGVPLEVLRTFQTELPENYLTIWFPTEICGFFGQIVNTHGVVSHRKFETCGNLWLRLVNTCVHLRWLKITLNKLKFACKLPHVSHRLATQRKSIQGGVRIVFTGMRTHGCTGMFFFATCVQLASTCNSVWAPIASLCFATACDSVWPRL